MTTDQIIRYCTSKKGAYKDYPFGEGCTVIKVRKRIFAQVFSLNGQSMLTFNGDIATGEFYRKKYPNIVTEGYRCPPVQQPYFNTVKLTGEICDDELKSMIDSSYAYVISRLPQKNRNEPAEKADEKCGSQAAVSGSKSQCGSDNT